MKVFHNVSLAGYTSLHAGGLAETLVELESGDNLAEEIAKLRGELWVLGQGTNCLVSDKGLVGTVVINKAGVIEKLGPTRLKVGSGVNWDDFVKRTVDENLWGLEFTSGIPGGSGAAVTGNIAAYGHKVADSFIEASVLNRQTGEVEIWENPKFEFSYRKSVLQTNRSSHHIILDSTFELSHEPTSELEYGFALKAAEDIGVKPDTLANRRQIIIEARRRSGSLLPDIAAGPFTAGSFFKNPIVRQEQAAEIMEYEERPRTKEQLLRQNIIHGENKSRVSAAHVLLAAGFHRGQTWGNVRLHPEHILKIENTGRASASEIYAVVQQILGTVKQRLNINLEPEVRFLGDF